MAEDGHDIQRTFALIKSGAVARRTAGAIIQAAEDAGLRVVRAELFRPLARDVAERLYAEHAGSPYHEGLIGSVTGPEGTVAMVLEGRSAVAAWRALMGATDPAQAKGGTLRARFGMALPDNATHGSDSEAAAAREAALFFAGGIMPEDGP